MLSVFGIQIQRHAAGRNETKLGKVTAPQCCCLDPKGLALWTDRCVLNGFELFYVCVFNVCVYLFADYAV